LIVPTLAARNRDAARMRHPGIVEAAGE
jgi:hypothetical protein